jgi:predicted dithiol-disulfide oxidoreductase (DUF899 family)
MSENHPQIVEKSEWESELANLLVEEKKLTRLADKIAAKRRRLPMYEVDTSYKFETQTGTKNLLDLFDGRQQLIVYHFMFDSDWEQGCPGCSWVLDAMSHEAHLNACGISLAIVGRAKLDKLLKYKERMGWKFSWASSGDSKFNEDFGATINSSEHHGVSVLFKLEDKVYRTYYSGNRGVERLGSHWTYQDLTPFGRKEDWEDSPEGWPQNKTYSALRRHDMYEEDGREN